MKTTTTRMTTEITKATNSLAQWKAGDGSNTTTLDCRNEYFRILGMIDILRIIGGDGVVFGMIFNLNCAKIAAESNCINLAILRGSR
jgi:hypothetical protein